MLNPSMYVQMPDPDYEADREVLRMLNILRVELWIVRGCKDGCLTPYGWGNYRAYRLAFRILKAKLLFKTKTQYERGKI